MQVLGCHAIFRCKDNILGVRIQTTAIFNYNLAIALTPFNCFGINDQGSTLTLTHSKLNYECRNFCAPGNFLHQQWFVNSFLGNVIQGGVCLVACPVLGPPNLHCINCSELNTVGPTFITLHEFVVPGLIIELHYICSVCLN